MKKSLVFGLIILVMVGLFVGCGEKKASDSKESTPVDYSKIPTTSVREEFESPENYYSQEYNRFYETASAEERDKVTYKAGNRVDGFSVKKVLAALGEQPEGARKLTLEDVEWLFFSEEMKAIAYDRWCTEVEWRLFEITGGPDLVWIRDGNIPRYSQYVISPSCYFEYDAIYGVGTLHESRNNQLVRTQYTRQGKEELVLE